MFKDEKQYGAELATRLPGGAVWKPAGRLTGSHLLMARKVPSGVPAESATRLPGGAAL